MARPFLGIANKLIKKFKHMKGKVNMAKITWGIQQPYLHRKNDYTKAYSSKELRGSI